MISVSTRGMAQVGRQHRASNTHQLAEVRRTAKGPKEKFSSRMKLLSTIGV